MHEMRLAVRGGREVLRPVRKPVVRDDQPRRNAGIVPLPAVQLAPAAEFEVLRPLWVQHREEFRAGRADSQIHIAYGFAAPGRARLQPLRRCVPAKYSILRALREQSVLIIVIQNRG